MLRACWMKNSSVERSTSWASIRTVFSSSLVGCDSWTKSRTSCLIIVAGTEERFLVYLRTIGPGLRQFACNPISSVVRPAWTAASNNVTRHEWAVIPLSRSMISALSSLGSLLFKMVAWWAKTRNHATARWWVGGRSSQAERVLSSGIQKSRSIFSFLWNRSQPTINQRSVWNPTLGTMNLVPARLRSTLVCHATPKRPSSFMTSSAGRTWIASSNLKEAKIMHNIHQMNNRVWAASRS